MSSRRQRALFPLAPAARAPHRRLGATRDDSSSAEGSRSGVEDRCRRAGPPRLRVQPRRGRVASSPRLASGRCCFPPPPIAATRPIPSRGARAAERTPPRCGLYRPRCELRASAAQLGSAPTCASGLVSTPHGGAYVSAAAFVFPSLHEGFGCRSGGHAAWSCRRLLGRSALVRSPGRRAAVDAHDPRHRGLSGRDPNRPPSRRRAAPRRRRAVRALHLSGDRGAASGHYARTLRLPFAYVATAPPAIPSTAGLRVFREPSHRRLSQLGPPGDPHDRAGQSAAGRAGDMSVPALLDELDRCVCRARPRKRSDARGARLYHEHVSSRLAAHHASARRRAASPPRPYKPWARSRPAPSASIRRALRRSARREDRRAQLGGQPRARDSAAPARSRRFAGMWRPRRRSRRIDARGRMS